LNAGIALSAISLVLVQGVVLADSRISFNLQGGWAYLAGGDVNHGTQGFFGYYEGIWPAANGGYRAVHNGYGLGGDVIFEITPQLGIGIGGGYMQISRASSMYLDDPEIATVYAGVAAQPRLSAVPVRASIHLTMPLSAKYNFHADIGASCYIKVRYNDDWLYSVWVMEEEATFVHIVTRAEKGKTPVGLQAGIGLEHKLSQGLFLCFNAQGQYARFRGLKGSSLLERDGEIPVSEQGKLYYEAVTMLPNAPRLIMVQTSPPSGPGGEPRQAAIDLSGISLQFGIKIRL
jgi:hypothetical protein